MQSVSSDGESQRRDGAFWLCRYHFTGRFIVPPVLKMGQSTAVKAGIWALLTWYGLRRGPFLAELADHSGHITVRNPNMGQYHRVWHDRTGRLWIQLIELWTDLSCFRNETGHFYVSRANLWSIVRMG